MSKVALVVNLEIDASSVSEFLAIAREHAEACVSEEPGCLGFEVLVPEDSTSRVVLFETYADTAAVESHLATPRMKRYLEKTAPMVQSRQRTACRVID